MQSYWPNWKRAEGAWARANIVAVRSRGLGLGGGERPFFLPLSSGGVGKESRHSNFTFDMFARLLQQQNEN